MPSSQWSVGVLWSAVATIEETRRALRPASRGLRSLRAGHLVDEVAVDVEERRAVRFLMDDMVVPELCRKSVFAMKRWWTLRR